MSPVAGFTRLRAHQFARQAAFGTPHAAVRRYPLSGVPDVNRNWTDQQVDTGSLIAVAAPYLLAPTVGASLSHPALCYNDLPLMLAGIFGGGEAGAGVTGDITWTWEPAMSAPLDTADFFSYEFGDDVTTDWFQLTDGVLSSLTIDSPEEGAGVLTAAMVWEFMDAASTGSTDHPVTGSVPAAGLSVDIDPTPVYLKDCSVYVDSTAGGIGVSQLTDTVHKFTLTITATRDQKRFANGTQSFGADDVATSAYAISLALVYAKTADTVGTGSEADAWFSDTAVPRYVKIAFESTRDADTAIPYTWFFSLPARYFTRTDGNIGGNSTVTLTANAFLDPTLDYAIHTEVVNTLQTHDLGANPS